MDGEEKPWWHDMYQEQKAKAREWTLQLIKESKTYPRPPANPDIYWTGKGNKIAMVDRKTGDYLMALGSDVENHKLSFIYRTQDETFVRGFNTQWGGGYYGMTWEAFPIRVYGIVESDEKTDAVRAALPRISMERFAEFIAAFPDFAEHPERDFVVFVAPRRPGERF